MKQNKKEIIWPNKLCLLGRHEAVPIASQPATPGLSPRTSGITALRLTLSVGLYIRRFPQANTNTSGRALRLHRCRRCRHLHACHITPTLRRMAGIHKHSEIKAKMMPLPGTLRRRLYYPHGVPGICTRHASTRLPKVARVQSHHSTCLVCRWLASREGGLDGASRLVLQGPGLFQK